MNSTMNPENCQNEVESSGLVEGEKPGEKPVSVWRQIIEDKRISHGAFRLWHYLRDHIDGQSECYPGYREIREKIGCQYDSITRWLGELQEANWLSVRTKHGIGRCNGSRNFYTILNGEGEPIKSAMVNRNANRYGKPSRLLRYGKPKRSARKKHSAALCNSIAEVTTSKESREIGPQGAESPASTSSPIASQGRSEANRQSTLKGSDRFAADQACKHFIARIPPEQLTDAIKAKVMNACEWSASEIGEDRTNFSSEDVQVHAEGLLFGVLPTDPAPVPISSTAAIGMLPHPPKESI
jgi:hypothetical protein